MSVGAVSARVGAKRAEACENRSAGGEQPHGTDH